VLPLNVRVLPALRSEARNLMERKGNERSSSTLRMISPTAPVAPTTATLGTTVQVLSAGGGRSTTSAVFKMGRALARPLSRKRPFPRTRRRRDGFALRRAVPSTAPPPAAAGGGRTGRGTR